VSILPWLQKYSKEIIFVTTAVIYNTVTSRSAISEEEADEILGEEKPLEAITRKIIGHWLEFVGKVIKDAKFIDKHFRDQVGGQLVLIGELLSQYSLKKE